ncbi:MAG: GyrI-like domain-containing protein [Spirochaetes bacterium]|nr:GyrI-like domain-containing protein [Spirochaetota bacterium]
MHKIDFKKKYKNLYNPSSKACEIIEVPEFQFLMIDGEGDPNESQIFAEACEALYSLSYTLKFMCKKGEMQLDYSVMPLEGLWWSDNMESFVTGDKDQWKWTIMILQPDFITENMVLKAIEKVKKKKNPVAVDKVRFEKNQEGLAAQIMHIGPYSEEAPTIEKLHQFIQDSGYELTGKHWEIYLGDPRKSKPENLKTIIRQPIK